MNLRVIIPLALVMTSALSKGDRHGTWTVDVSGNWRVTFRFAGPDVTDVNYEDYH